MAELAPDSPEAAAVYQIRRTLTICPKLIELAGTADRDVLKSEHIFDTDFDFHDLGDTSPVVCVSEESSGSTLIGASEGNDLRPFGESFVYAAVRLPQIYDDRDEFVVGSNDAERRADKRERYKNAQTFYRNYAGGIKSFLGEMSGKDWDVATYGADPIFPYGHLNVSQITAYGGFENDEEKWPTEGRWYRAGLSVLWGFGGQ